MAVDQPGEISPGEILDMVDTYAAGPYQPQTQRARTERALTVLTRQRPSRRPIEWSLRSPALSIDVLLPDPVMPGHPQPSRSVKRRRDWFAAFLDDQPQWRQQLVRWIADRWPCTNTIALRTGEAILASVATGRPPHTKIRRSVMPPTVRGGRSPVVTTRDQRLGAEGVLN